MGQQRSSRHWGLNATSKPSVRHVKGAAWRYAGCRLLVARLLANVEVDPWVITGWFIAGLSSLGDRMEHYSKTRGGRLPKSQATLTGMLGGAC